MTIMPVRLRRWVLAAIAVPWVVALGLTFVRPAPVAKAAVPTVGDYLVRIARAMGLESRVGTRAPVEQYLALLVEQGVITADVAPTLRVDQPLTRDFALEVSGRVSVPPAPSFLSRTYVLTTVLAEHGTGLGFVRDGGGDDEDQGLFDARHKAKHHCPTPRHRHEDEDERECPEEP